MQSHIHHPPPLFGFRFIQQLNTWWSIPDLFVYFLEEEAGAISVRYNNERIGLVYWSHVATLTISINPSFPHATDVALYLKRTLSTFLMNTAIRIAK